MEPRDRYFKGWYCKLQTRDGDALALIPALHIDSRGRRSASLQVISRERSWWLAYPGAAFQQKGAQLRLGENLFQPEGVWLQIQTRDLSLQGKLRFGPAVGLRSDIMGPFRFLPNMECVHGVHSMGHAVDGTLCLNGRRLDFAGGLGYVESDRGRSFPERYLWAQSSWQGAGSLMLAVATIPLAGYRFTGCICAVLHGGQEYRLATYRGVKVLAWWDRGAVIRQGRYRLAVEVLERQMQPLRAPVEGEMGRTIHESLCARLRCRFWVGEQLLFDRVDHCAGFEYAGGIGTK